MGVNGLWQVLQPCARPTNLATLNKKRLAVDASIWIYQFLKAVRDKEGNALRNSHVVGFFRRICKLLWFGIRPIFVFDGGAPALKRATLQGRRRRREGRREDAVRTAGKLLAVQMQRLAEEEDDRRRRGREPADADGVAPGEALPSAESLVYADEAQMSNTERQRSRKFFKQDAYHLPELQNGIEAMGRPEDPRIMSIDELEEYARQFHNGEDINLYDFSKIDFDGEFFKSLPPADRYNILNAARLRSRLRMGLSKEQLDGMFPDRMAFSRFQIERVRERNNLTQRLMQEAGMTGLDLTLGGSARVAGEKDREYILVKNEGAEGGWALGVVSKEKDRGEMHKPIDVDALQLQFQTKDESSESDDGDFEDVPIEGLNRLPRFRDKADMEDDSMFVDSNLPPDLRLDAIDDRATLVGDEDDDLNRAIALSLQAQHGVGAAGQDDRQEEQQDVPSPQWSQRAVEAPKRIITTSGKMVAHIVNNRASAAVANVGAPKGSQGSNDSSDSEDDFRAALAAARKKKKAEPRPVATITAPPNMKNPFDGPLPFEKLDWRKSVFGAKPPPEGSAANQFKDAKAMEPESDEDGPGGFELIVEDNRPRPLPPWMVDNTDIRESIQQQQVTENEINAEDREFAEEQERLEKKYRDHVIEVDSSDDNESDIEILDAPPTEPNKVPTTEEPSLAITTAVRLGAGSGMTEGRAELANERPQDTSPTISNIHSVDLAIPAVEFDRASSSSESDIAFEDVNLPTVPNQMVDEELPDVPLPTHDNGAGKAPLNEREPTIAAAAATGEQVFADDEFDDFSDPEEDELLAQMAEEAEEHARFASTLNNKSTRENQEAYERELKALRSQQKKDRRDADEVTQIMVTECQALLRLFGIPYITAPMEAEAQCAEFVSLGLVDGIITDDSDTFLFGGTRVYKNMFNSNKFVECYLSTDLEKDLSLSRDQLISIAQLLGSDYTEGIPGVGPVTAIEILSEFPGANGLNEFREWWQDVQVHGRPKEADAKNPFRKKFRKSHAAKLFLPTMFPNPAVPQAYLHPEVDDSTENFQWGVPDLEGLRQFLMSTIGWSQERTDEVLVPVIKDMNRREAEGTQSNITRFFQGSVGAGAKEAFAPRQKGKGSRRMAAAVDKLRAKRGTAAGEPEDDRDDDNGAEGSRIATSSGRKRKARNSTAVDDDDDDDDDEAEDADGRDGDTVGAEKRSHQPPRSQGKRAKGAKTAR
jgi:DNA excision repair protein ERCC-5